MRMFDNVKCEYPLPEAPRRIQKSNFITKSLINIFDDYTITSEGRLIHHQCTWDIVPEKERPYYGTPEWNDNPVFQIFGSMKRTPIEDVDVKYDGIVTIYTSDPDNPSVLYNYELKFVGGTVVDIKSTYKEYGDK